MDVYFYRLGIFFQSIFDVNSQVTWDTKLVTYIAHISRLTITRNSRVPPHLMDSVPVKTPRNRCVACGSLWKIKIKPQEKVFHLW